jgi:hypothetical protein
MCDTLGTTLGEAFAVGLNERMLAVVDGRPGLTDRELTDILAGKSAGPQAVNQAARALAASGSLVRARRPDGRIGNYPSGAVPPHVLPDYSAAAAPDSMTEDAVKAAVRMWLEKQGWEVKVRWGHAHGVDVEAVRGSERWVIEAKGGGSLQPMRVNYFLAILGETLQHMDDPVARYSIALPDMAQFRALWNRLPQLAKTRTAISLILVGRDASIVHLD